MKTAEPTILDAPTGSLRPPASTPTPEPCTSAAEVAWKRHEHETRFKIDVARRELENGYILLFAMELPGVHAQGRGIKAALKEFRGVLGASLSILREKGGSIPFARVNLEAGDLPFTSLEVDA